ncbi:hypothetical protein AAF712_004182 [Marasmius tenuissimus]|uniref:BSD domain-containing protein n=1 Tax=Marasmius tenuissimus TaxID=585030 RepID=A0ABR3A677_9AGAR
MNFLDPYDITANTTNTPPPENPNQPSLNDEVTQVITSFKGFWGGFRQQSQAVLETARKDFSSVVEQAQKELTKLTAEDSGSATTAAASTSRSPTVEDAQPRSSVETVKPATTEDSSTSPSTSTEEQQPTSSTRTTLFSRLQSALPPNVVSTVQANIPESLKNADFAQIRTNLTTEFQRIQGVTRTQAEEYVQKSEVLLREAMKEAGDVLRDAVKVIPPEEGSGDAATGSRSAPVLTWDGSDMWMLPGASEGNVGGKGKEKEGVTSGSVSTRAEALLKTLRHNPDILKHDPEVDKGAPEGAYLKWAEENVGQGIDSEEWSGKIKKDLDESDDLQATLDALVPAEMSREVFWKRYFYRVHQIRQEEETRKALLQGTVESDEDFDWEDEDGDEDASVKNATPTSIKSVAATLTPQASTPANVPSSDKSDKGTATPLSPQANTPANTSPRHSSEDSYDLVSSGNVSASGDTKKDSSKGKPSTEDSDDDGDSDWE